MNRVGSVWQVIDSAGNVVKYCTFEPFGRTIESGGTFDDPFGFTGQYFDAEIGEYYLRARQYNPTIARFTARDPVFGKLEQPLSLHKYLYCENDPVNLIDPVGLMAYYLTATSQGAAGVGLTTQTGLTWDDDGNVGLIAIGGGGFGSIFGTVGVSFGVTTADTIFDLRGRGAAGGVGSPFTGGWEYVVGLDEYGNPTWKGVEFTYGGTLTPAFLMGCEVHAYWTETVVIPFNGSDDELSDAFMDMTLESETIGQASFLLKYGEAFLQ